MQPLFQTNGSFAGDDGSTELLDGVRRSKADLLFDALGSLDELNAALGLLRAARAGSPDADWIESIQRDLLDIGGELAAGQPRLDASAVVRITAEVARIGSALPPVCGFVLPGASEPSARAHGARAVCRRAERELVRARDSRPDSVSPTALAYLNRLSIWLFALALALDAPPENRDRS